MQNENITQENNRTTNSELIDNIQTSNDSDIQPDIFEAIRHLHPYHHMLYLKNSPIIDYKIPEPIAEILRYDNGRRVGLPYSFEADRYKDILATLSRNGQKDADSFNLEFFRQQIRTHLPGFYRGEYKYHEKTPPSGQRDISKKTNIPFDVQELIDKLKIEEFTQIAKTFPSTILAQIDKIDIRWEALAQHYGLRSNLIDITSEPFIAAFFATHRYDDNTEKFMMITNGIGCIKKAHSFALINPHDKAGINSIIGIQHFRRPTLQRAFCWKEYTNYNNVLHEGVDSPQNNLKLNWRTIKFIQSRKMTQKIHDLFYKGNECILFPDEVIAKAARSVEKRNAVTISSVYAVSEQINISPDEIIHKLKSVGYPIVSTPAFNLSKSQFRSICSEIERLGLYGNTIKFERKVMLGDKGGKAFEPDDSYSTYDAGMMSTISAIFLLGNEIFKIV